MLVYERVCPHEKPKPLEVRSVSDMTILPSKNRTGPPETTTTGRESLAPLPAPALPANGQKPLHTGVPPPLPDDDEDELVLPLDSDEELELVLPVDSDEELELVLPVDSDELELVLPVDSDEELDELVLPVDSDEELELDELVLPVDSDEELDEEELVFPPDSDEELELELSVSELEEEKFGMVHLARC